MKPREWRLLFPDRAYGAELSGPELARGIERIATELLIAPERGDELKAILAGAETSPRSFSRRSPIIDIQNTRPSWIEGLEVADAAEIQKRADRLADKLGRQLISHLKRLDREPVDEAATWSAMREILATAGVLDVESIDGKRGELLLAFWKSLARELSLTRLRGQSARIAGDLERRSQKESVFASGVAKYRELFDGRPPANRSELESRIEDAPQEARILIIEALHHFPYDRFVQAVNES